MILAPDYIMNGQGYGGVAQQLLASGLDVNVLRPFVGRDGRSYITVNQYDPKTDKMVQKAVPTTNANATLRKDEWLMLDSVVIKAAKERLRAVADLRQAGLTFNIANGMGTTVLQTQTVSDITPAEISMDGLRESERDRPEYGLANLPLPIISKDLSFTLREIAVSRRGGTPIDTTAADLAARRVAEEVEKLLIGTTDSYTYGGGTIYGYRNYPSRMTHEITDPTDVGWTPKTLVQEILAMRQKLTEAYHYGPYFLYMGTAWDAYLDEDYSDDKGDNTLRERLAKIDSVDEVRTLDHLPGFEILIVQKTSDVVREVIGMDITTVQWETHGGMKLHFKIMCIMVPQLRKDHNNNTGIVHGAVAE